MRSNHKMLIGFDVNFKIRQSPIYVISPLKAHLTLFSFYIGES